MSIKIKHPIFSATEFNIKVTKESDCSKCIHKRVCKKDMTILCKNYEFGSNVNGYLGCNSCLHRYTRFDSMPIPCFRCKYYSRNKGEK